MTNPTTKDKSPLMLKQDMKDTQNLGHNECKIFLIFPNAFKKI